MRAPPLLLTASAVLALACGSPHAAGHASARGPVSLPWRPCGLGRHDPGRSGCVGVCGPTAVRPGPGRRLARGPSAHRPPHAHRSGALAHRAGRPRLRRERHRGRDRPERRHHDAPQGPAQRVRTGQAAARRAGPRSLPRVHEPRLRKLGRARLRAAGRGPGRGGGEARRGRVQGVQATRPVRARPQGHGQAHRHRRSEARPHVAATGPAGDAGVDPRRRPEGLLGAVRRQERALGRARGSPPLVVRRSEAVPAAHGAARGARARHRSPPGDHLRLRAHGQQRRGPRVGRRPARRPPEHEGRHRRPRARVRPRRSGGGAARSSSSTRTGSSSRPTSRSTTA